MAAFVNDTMTTGSDVALTAHTGETGATWTKHTSWSSSDQSLVVASIDRLRPNFGGETNVHYASGTPPSADYKVVGQMYYAGTGAAPEVGVCGRIDSGTKTAYVAFWDNNVGWVLTRYKPTLDTVLGTYSQTSLTATQTYELKLEMIGSAIKVYIDSIERISVTDTEITAAGFIGTYLDGVNDDGGDGYGLHIDSIVGDVATTTYQNSGTDGTKLGDSVSYIVRPTPSICRIVGALA